MDGISDDPELAQELLKLLHAKLRDARQELQDQRRVSEIALLDSTDLQRQNEELRDELAAVRFQLSVAAEHEDLKAGIGEDTSLDEEIREQLLALQERKTAADTDIGKKKLQLQKYKAKYRELRADIAGLEEHILRLQAKVERESTVLKECESHILVAETELCALGPSNAATPPFDIYAFITTPTEQPDDSEMSSWQSILKTAPLLKLPEELLEQFGPLELLVLPREDVMWSEGGIGRAVFVTPSHHYDPTARANSGSWQVNSSLDDLINGAGRTRELFIRETANWYYYGSYQCVGFSRLSADTSKALAGPVVRHAAYSTTLHKDHLAPLALKFVDSLYLTGPLELHGFAFERTGFDHDLYEALVSSIPAIQEVNARAASQSNAAAASVVRKLRCHDSGPENVSSTSPKLSRNEKRKKQRS